MSVLSAMLLLFLVMDPLGNTPTFMVVLQNVEERRRPWIIVRELCIALAVLLVFLFAGQRIMSLLQVSQSSLGIAGGLILFLIAIRMIFARSREILGPDPVGEPLVVPLAVPLIAGPSAMATVILLMAREPGRWLAWAGALVAAWFATGVILLLSGVLSRLLGKRGLLAVERLMGMLLTTVAVEMFVTGLRRSFAP